MVSLTRFLIAAASMLFGLPMAFASQPDNATHPEAFDPFTSEPASMVCNEIAVTSPITTSHFTLNQKGDGARRLFLGAGSAGKNPSVAVVYGPYTTNDKVLFAKIHSAIKDFKLSITYTEKSNFDTLVKQTKYFTINGKEFCAVTGSEKWTEIVAVSSFQEAV